VNRFALNFGLALDLDKIISGQMFDNHFHFARSFRERDIGAVRPLFITMNRLFTSNIIIHLLDKKSSKKSQNGSK
jgi:hypothetical protein